MKTTFTLILLLILFAFSNAQNNSMNDPEAGALLKASSAKYKSMGAVEVEFTLTTRSPKIKADEPESKYIEVLNGKIWLKGNQFKIVLNGNEVYCNGKDIWTYIVKNKECQLNEYVESDQVFSPSKIFNLVESGYPHQIKEKKNFKGKNVTVIEMLPGTRKVSFFKIDAAIDDNTKEVLEVKIYEKNGVHYIYNISKLTVLQNISSSDFAFDAKKHPGVNIVDLR
jgi:outer membrane lipoprotein-sorting protein